MNKIEIPSQLKKNYYRFVLISKNKKYPFEEDWINSRNYSFQSKQLKRHLMSGNYGVATGNGGLVVIDFDSIKEYDRLKNLLPPTFTVLSAGKKLPHMYYKVYDVDEPKTFHVDEIYYVDKGEKKKRRLADVMGKGAQVVGANSKIGTHKYVVWKDLPITILSYESLKAVIKSDDEVERKNNGCIITEKLKKAIPNKDIKKSDEDYMLDFITVKNVAERLGVTFKKKNHGNCPLGHSSQGGMCFHCSDKLWYCFHCGEGGNYITLVSKYFKISNREAVDWLKKEFLKN